MIRHGIFFFLKICIMNALPSISVSGNRGARAINNPPNPHPTSANSGVLPESANAG